MQHINCARPPACHPTVLLLLLHMCNLCISVLLDQDRCSIKTAAQMQLTTIEVHVQAWHGTDKQLHGLDTASAAALSNSSKQHYPCTLPYSAIQTQAESTACFNVSRVLAGMLSAASMLS